MYPGASVRVHLPELAYLWPHKRQRGRDPGTTVRAPSLGHTRDAAPVALQQLADVVQRVLRGVVFGLHDVGDQVELPRVDLNLLLQLQVLQVE
jgi:hypothetical protein